MTDDLETEYPQPAESPGLMLWRVTNTWQRRVRAVLAPHGITHVQFVLLATLTWMDRDQPVTQRSLADHAGIDIMMTSQVVRVLEAKGYITRHAHPADRRAIILSPTPAGIDLANRANVDVEAVDRSYFSALGSTPKATFIHCLQQLNDAQTGT
jgi:DNA-binding MarR family transcriptional regulator